jgi:hypothetical protein
MGTNADQVIHVCNFEDLFFYRVDIITFSVKVGSTLTTELNPKTCGPRQVNRQKEQQEQQFEASIGAQRQTARTRQLRLGAQGGGLPRRRS